MCLTGSYFYGVQWVEIKEINVMPIQKSVVSEADVC